GRKPPARRRSDCSPLARGDYSADTCVGSRRGATAKIKPPPGSLREAVWFDACFLCREIAEFLEVLLLLVVARRQLEQPRRGAAENVVLGLLRQEGQVVDRARQVEIPVRVIRGVEQLGLGVDHAEGAFERLAILN